MQPPYLSKVKSWEKYNDHLIKRKDVIIINPSSENTSCLKSSPYFDLEKFKQGEKYIWIIDFKGEAIIAKEKTSDTDKNYLGHPCLTGEGGRIGGELIYKEGKVFMSPMAGRFCYEDRTDEHLKNAAELVRNAFGQIGLAIETKSAEAYREKKKQENKLYSRIFQSLPSDRSIST